MMPFTHVAIKKVNMLSREYVREDSEWENNLLQREVIQQYLHLNLTRFEKIEQDISKYASLIRDRKFSALSKKNPGAEKIFRFLKIKEPSKQCGIMVHVDKMDEIDPEIQVYPYNNYMMPIEKADPQILRQLDNMEGDQKNDGQKDRVIAVLYALDPSEVEKENGNTEMETQTLSENTNPYLDTDNIISELKRDNHDKIFLVYDLGGGTFDISIAQHINGHVNLLAQGGREMCGGRDIDRRIYSDRIMPWLRAHFDIPENPDADPHWVELKKRVLLAVEEAKIVLSGSETSDLYMDEDAVDIQDLKGEDVYIDLTLSRNDLTEIIEEMAAETAELSQETMIRAGIRKADADQIIFIGGPTMYAPLREAVCRNLGISRGTSVNPMTSVAEGASIYAESIHWDSDTPVTKEKSEELATQQDIKIRYEKRTSLDWGRVAVLARDSALRIVRIQSVCQDTTERSEKDEKTFKEGERFFDSGEVPFSGQVIVNVPLPEMGVHGFKLDIFDGSKENLLESRKIEITRIFASIRSVPASHSIALKVLDSIGGKAVPLYLVEENDPLPKYGSITLHAGEQLVGGGSGALSFSLWEGEIREPIDDNRYIGTYRIPASEIGRCIVPVGTVIECDYEMNEAGNIRLGASIPSIGLYMGSQNFYSRIEGQVDLQDTASLVRETNQLLERTAQMKQRIVDEKLSEIRRRLVKIRDVFSHSADSEEIAASEDKLLRCYHDIAVLAQKYETVIRTQELQDAKDRFKNTERYALAAEIARFNNYVDLAHYAIEMGSSDFEEQMKRIYQLINTVLWRNEVYIHNLFMFLIRNPGNYSDRAAFDRLRAEGLTALENKKTDLLKKTIHSLLEYIIPDQHNISTNAAEMFHDVNVYR